MKEQIILRYARTEYGKKVRKDYEAGKLKIGWGGTGVSAENRRIMQHNNNSTKR